HQDQRGLDDDRAGDRHALLLAAGELAGELVLLADQLHQLHRMRDLGIGVRAGDAAHAQTEADVFRDAHVREQRVILEHHAEAALFRRQGVDPRLIEPDTATRKAQKPGDAVERGRLAAPRRPEERDELTAPDGQGQLVQRVERLATGAGEAARDVIEPQLGKIMFHLPPAAAPMRVLDRRLTLFSWRRPHYPSAGTLRPPPWLPRSARADTGRASLRIRDGRTRGSRPGFPSAPSTAERSSPTAPDRSSSCRRSAPAPRVSASTPSGPARPPAYPAGLPWAPPCSARR